MDWKLHVIEQDGKTYLSSALVQEMYELLISMHKELVFRNRENIIIRNYLGACLKRYEEKQIEGELEN